LVADLNCLHVLFTAKCLHCSDLLVAEKKLA
jgi:hypothetical protein